MDEGGIEGDTERGTEDRRSTEAEPHRMAAPEGEAGPDFDLQPEQRECQGEQGPVGTSQPDENTGKEGGRELRA